MRLRSLFALALAAGCASAPDGTLPAAVAPVAAASAQEVDARPGVAVMPFNNGGSYGAKKEDLDALETGMQQMLLTELSQNPNLRVVERSLIRDILAEQDLATGGRVDPRTAAAVGKLVGARYVITGSFIDMAGNFRLDGRIVNVETGEIVKAEYVTAKREKMYGVVVDLAEKITRGVSLPPLPKEVQQARRARSIPDEALSLYSRALTYEDLGQPDKAIELYRRIVTEFPQYTEAKQALEQLTEA